MNARSAPASRVATLTLEAPTMRPVGDAAPITTPRCRLDVRSSRRAAKPRRHLRCGR